MKKKILYIAEAFGGGVFTYFTELANAVAEEYEVLIAYAKRAETPENFERFFRPDIRFVEILNFQRSVNPLQDFKAMQEIRHLVREYGPDIIHLHSSKAGFCGRMAINCKKHRVYYTPHGYAFLKQDDSALKRKIYFLAEKVLSTSHAKVIGVSKGEYEEALKLTKNAMYINNGIDIAKIPKGGKKEFDREHPVICTLGRISFPKNPSMFNRIAESFPEWKFIWIGDGDLRSELTASNIEITGWMDREEATEQLARADVFLIPSLWEGLPVALLEAMYQEKLCIASRVIGNRDVMINGENGFLADRYEDYVRILKDVSSGKIPVEKIQKRAKQDVVESYSTTKMCGEYLRVYREDTK